MRTADASRASFQQQAFAVSEVTLREDPTDDGIVTVLLQPPRDAQRHDGVSTAGRGGRGRGSGRWAAGSAPPGGGRTGRGKWKMGGAGGASTGTDQWCGRGARMGERGWVVWAGRGRDGLWRQWCGWGAGEGAGHVGGG